MMQPPPNGVPPQMAAPPPTYEQQQQQQNQYHQYQQQQWMMANQQQQQPPPSYQYQPQQQMYFQQPPQAAAGQRQYSAAPAQPVGADEFRTLWIGDLQYWMDEQYLINCFAHTGEMAYAKVIRDKQTGQSEGYGFIDFLSHAAAERTLQAYNGTVMPNAEQNYRLNWASLGGGEKRSDGTPDFTIFVGDLAPDVTDHVLQETFRSHYPSVKGAKIVTDMMTGRTKGYGFVRFGDESEQVRAMNEMNGKFCSTRPMRIGPANKKNTASYQNTRGTQSEDDPNNTTIFVGGLNDSVSADQLRQVFIQYGVLLHVKIPEGKRCGFVQFADRNCAEEALRMLNGTQLGGQNIRLSWCRCPPNKQLQRDPNQLNSGYYGYAQGQGTYGYAAAAQDPNLYNAGYPGYGNYQQPQQQAVTNPNVDYSHFVSLPLATHPELVDKLLNFRKSILGTSNANENENLDSDSDGGTSEEQDKGQGLDTRSNVAVKLNVEGDNEHVKVDITNIRRVSYPTRASKPSDLGIEKSIFINPKTFHLTVLMLKLWNKDRVDTAAEVLQNVSSKVLKALGSRPVSVRLKGLECMRGTLAKAGVVYIPVEEIGGEGRLSRACQVIIDAFVEAGLVLEKDGQRKLKLHATVMNARFRKGTRKFDSFDARGIFKQFGSEEWGEYLIREAHLSQRFEYDENGYYHRCASFPFPETKQLD